MSARCEVRDLHHPHGLLGVSLAIQPGEVVAVLGPSGAGKTTLCRCVLGLATPSLGSVWLDGERFSGVPERLRRRRRRHVQGLPQDPTTALDPRQTVLEHVQETLVVLAKRPAADAEGLLASLGLDHRAGALPRELSVGEQRRVTLARVLALRPRLVVADEPTGALDPERRAAVLEALLANRPEGGALLWVTHEVDLVARFATRLVGLVDGRIVDDVSWPTERPTHPWMQRAMMVAGVGS